MLFFWLVIAVPSSVYSSIQCTRKHRYRQYMKKLLEFLSWAGQGWRMSGEEQQRQLEYIIGVTRVRSGDRCTLLTPVFLGGTGKLIIQCYAHLLYRFSLHIFIVSFIIF